MGYWAAALCAAWPAWVGPQAKWRTRFVTKWTNMIGYYAIELPQASWN